MVEKLTILVCLHSELRDFEPDDQQEIEVDEGNTAVIECHLPESQPKAQVRYSVKQEWLETSKGTFYLFTYSFAILLNIRRLFSPRVLGPTRGPQRTFKGVQDSSQN